LDRFLVLNSLLSACGECRVGIFLHSLSGCCYPAA
jgi:hypothetical protein